MDRRRELLPRHPGEIRAKVRRAPIDRFDVGDRRLEQHCKLS
jgi:hypothetical protein